MNKFFLIGLSIFWMTVSIISPMYGQILPDRYNEEVFGTITETNEVLFSTDVPTPVPGGGFYEWVSDLPLNVNEYETTDENLYMDIFEPEGDTITKRPLVIVCFGGGFLTGSKDHWSIRELAIQLAKRGYVTATIDYRLGMNIFDEDLSKRAPYRGLQDGRSAIRYFRADSAGNNDYKIDTDNIYIGGHSAGAFVALHTAYLDQESERPLSTYDWTQDGEDVPDQLCIDCVGNNLDYSGHADAVFSLAGALGDTLYLESSSDQTLVMFHSEDDDTVPYDSGTPFESQLLFVVGDDLPVVYGSESISIRADVVGLEYDFNSYTDRGHDVHEETSSTLYDDIIPQISDSFFINLLKPIAHPITGDIQVCKDADIVQYSTIADEAKYYDWEVIGGTILNLDNESNTIDVKWDTLAVEQKLYLTPYSSHAARGAKDSISINILDIETNTWIGSDGSWDTPNDWSLGYLPEICHDVVYPDQSPIINVFLPVDMEVFIHSLKIGHRVDFDQKTGSVIHVLGK